MELEGVITSANYTEDFNIPVMGLNKRDPLATMASAYSPWLLNWDPEPQYCRVRGDGSSTLQLTI